MIPSSCVRPRCACNHLNHLHGFTQADDETSWLLVNHMDVRNNGYLLGYVSGIFYLSLVGKNNNNSKTC